MIAIKLGVVDRYPLLNSVSLKLRLAASSVGSITGGPLGHGGTRERHHQVPSNSPASNEKRKGRRGLAANWRFSHSYSFSPSGFHEKAPDWESTLPKTSGCLSPTKAACNPPKLAPPMIVCSGRSVAW